jgi:HEAT repeat protein
MAIEEEHQDVLQNIEFGIIQVYREKSDLIDAEVLTAIDALVRLYGAEAQGKTLSPRSVRGIAKQVMESVQAMCEWRLGRSRLEDIEGKFGELPPPESIDVIVECLKRIQSSIKFWTQKGGRQGYLNFVKQFIV